MRLILRSVLAAAVVLAAGRVRADDKPAALAIEDGASVELEYTLTDESGQVLDTNKGEKPLTYTQGKRQLLPALERQLIGLHAGDEKKVSLGPSDAFGPVDPNAVVEVAKETIPDGALEVGAQLIGRTPKGETRPVTVKEIREETVILDLNHPLAGKTVLFAIKIVGVMPPVADAPKTVAPAPAAPAPVR